jgi:H+/Cl- antiporter ClcA
VDITSCLICCKTRFSVLKSINIEKKFAPLTLHQQEKFWPSLATDQKIDFSCLTPYLILGVNCSKLFGSTMVSIFNNIFLADLYHKVLIKSLTLRLLISYIYIYKTLEAQGLKTIFSLAATTRPFYFSLVNSLFKCVLTLSLNK